MALIDAERRGLERTGVRLAGRIGSRMRREAVEAFVAGGDPLVSVRIGLAKLEPMFSRAMLAAHLTGAIRTVGIVVPEIREQLALQIFDQSVEFAKRRLDLSDAQIAEIAARYDAEAARAVRGVSGKMDRAIKQTVVVIADQGLTRRDGVPLIRKAFKRAGVVGVTRGGVAIAAPLFETLFRTNIAVAYSAGRWETAQDPAVQNILWGWEYFTVGDDRVRDEHILLNGVRLPKEDPRWSRIWPPNAWNCRCTTIEIFEPVRAKEPRSKIIDGVRVDPEPDAGFAFNPGQIFGRSPAGI